MFLAGLLRAALAVVPPVQRDFWGTESSPCPAALPTRGQRAALLLGRADETTTITFPTTKVSACLSVWLRPFAYLWRPR